MKFTPSNPLDPYHSQIEIENFKEEQQQKKEFMESVKLIASNAEKQSDTAIKQVLALQAQLELSKSEAESAKKESLFSKTLSIVAIIVSLLIPFIEWLLRL